MVLAEGGAEGAQSHGCGTNEVLVTVRNALIEPRQCGLDEPAKKASERHTSKSWSPESSAVSRRTTATATDRSWAA